jgi:hypothetical protein
MVNKQRILFFHVNIHQQLPTRNLLSINYIHLRNKLAYEYLKVLERNYLGMFFIKK